MVGLMLAASLALSLIVGGWCCLLIVLSCVAGGEQPSMLPCPVALLISRRFGKAGRARQVLLRCKVALAGPGSGDKDSSAGERILPISLEIWVYYYVHDCTALPQYTYRVIALDKSIVSRVYGRVMKVPHGERRFI